MPSTLINQLKEHSIKARALREQLKISSPGELIYWRDLSPVDDEMVIVVADGFGGAEFSVIQGQYPFDYETLESKIFASEEEATRKASDWDT
jgi:hypothetical protein